MLRGDVIRLMSALLASTIGYDALKTSSVEFQEDVAEGMAFVDAAADQVRSIGAETDISAVWTPSDCEALFNLIAALQATQATECPIA